MYTQDPKDETKVIDTEFKPPSIDPKKLSEELNKLKQTLQDITDDFNQNSADLNKEIEYKQSQLDAIYKDVPVLKTNGLQAEIINE